MLLKEPQAMFMQSVVLSISFSNIKEPFLFLYLCAAVYSWCYRRFNNVAFKISPLFLGVSAFLFKIANTVRNFQQNCLHNTKLKKLHKHFVTQISKQPVACHPATYWI